MKKLHHIGLKVPWRTVYEFVCLAIQVAGFERVQDDVKGDMPHKRSYFQISDDPMWFEVQCFDDHKWGVHLDIVAPSPRHAAEEVMRALKDDSLELEPLPGGNGPSIFLKVYELFAIMWRSEKAGDWIPGVPNVDLVDAQRRSSIRTMRH